MPKITPHHKSYKTVPKTAYRTATARPVRKATAKTTSKDKTPSKDRTTSKAAGSSYKIGEAAELLGVSVQKMRRWADSAGLLKERSKGQHRRIDGKKLAEFIQKQQAEETPGAEQSALSARNRFQGLVIKVTKDKVTAQVEIQAGKYRIVALTTREAADSLGLIPGVMASAAVKSTNVIVEKSEL